MYNMVLRDNIIEQKPTKKTSDGQGGFISSEPEERTIICKASFNTSPEVMNAYGQHGEQVLYVVTREPLLEEAFYLYKNKKFNVRFMTNNNRLYFSTLVEIK